jgi:4-amino-4-deoxy-L-arabinose transferase-like glycosyltransferase
MAAGSVWTDLVVWGIVLAAFLLRLGYNLALHPAGHPQASFVIDEREYFGAAHMLAEGRGFSFFDTALWVRPPLYVIALAGIMLAAGSDYLPTLVFQSLLSALTIPAFAWLAFQVAGRTAARWAALLALLYLPLTLFAGLLLSETLFVFLFAWGVVASMKARSTLKTYGVHARSTWGWVVAAGILLGFGVLTRATALGFVPLAAAWVAVPARSWSRRALVAGVVLVCALLTLVPWTLRNYSAYKHLIPVDTTSGYNLWLASLGVRDEARLEAELRTIANPADRQTYAFSRAVETIRSNPGSFLAKGLKESADLWAPQFSAEERQIRGYTLGRVPAWQLTALLVFDDLLYLAILLLSVAGLALSPPHPLKTLTALWVVLWVAIAFIFFAVTRFRLPVIAMLIPWAGAGATLVLPLRMLPNRVRSISKVAQVAALLALVGVAVLVVPRIDIGNTALGISRWSEQEPYRQAEVLLRSGRVDEAIELYLQANQAVSDTRYGLAAAYLQKGRVDDALALLAADTNEERFEPPILRGQAARLQGNLDAARTLFMARPVQLNPEAALDWAWDHLTPAAADTVEVGSGLDVGYIRGFHAAEKDSQGKPFRWSTDSGEVRLLRPSNRLGVEWNAWRPKGPLSVAPVVTLSGDGSLNAGPLPPDDRWVVAPLTGSTTQDESAEETLTISTRPFIGAGSDPRLLGLRVSNVGSTAP